MPNSDTHFIPRVLDKSVFISDIDYSYVIFDAHTTIYLNQIFSEATEKFKGIIIDPVTHFIQFQNQRLKASYQELPYSKVQDLSKLIADPTYRLEQLVIPVIDFQYNQNCEFIIAPYFCSEDLHSTIFSTNITLLGESINNVSRREQPLPILAPVSIGANSLREKVVINAIVDHYTDPAIADKIEGYYLMVSEFNDRKADIRELFGLADLVFQLSQGKKVIVKQVGFFGLVLAALGAFGFTSSPAGGETFSLSHYRNNFARQRNHNELIYVPEILNYVNEFELTPQRINYNCDCHACTNPSEYESKTQQRKVHFLLRRQQELKDFQQLDRVTQIDYLLARFDEAIQKVSEYKVNFGSDISALHIQNWSEVLKQAKIWNYAEDQKELEELLSALD